jgi:hypothetical protein
MVMSILIFFFAMGKWNEHRCKKQNKHDDNDDEITERDAEIPNAKKVGWVV